MVHSIASQAVSEERFSDESDYASDEDEQPRIVPARREREDILRHKSIANAQVDLLFSGEYADAAVTCLGLKWEIHRSMLCTRSQYFKACFDGNYQETKTWVSNLDDELAYAVEGLLVYLYSFDYPVRTLHSVSSHPGNPSKATTSTPKTVPALVQRTEQIPQFDYGKHDLLESRYKSIAPILAYQFHLALFKLADKMLLTSLANLAAKKLAQSCMEASLSSENFIVLLKELWTMQQKGLIAASLSALTAATHNVDQISRHPSFDELIETCPKLGAVLIRRVAEAARESTAMLAKAHVASTGVSTYVQPTKTLDYRYRHFCNRRPK